MWFYNLFVKYYWIIRIKINWGVPVFISKTLIKYRNYKVTLLAKDLSLKSKLEHLLGNFSTFDCPTNLKEELITLANDYLEDKYSVLGSSKTTIKRGKWNIDFKTKYMWKVGLFYLRYKIIDYSTKSDVKFPWEISRCHHLLILGEAYLLTKESKYAQKIKLEILSWIKENPFQRSINWTCAMEVAIRSVNWLYAINMISKSSIYDEDFEYVVNTSLNQHRFFIENNLEKSYPYSGNHYIANLVGIIHLYLLFYEDPKKINITINEYFNEIRSQVLPSGFHFEKSTSYHKLVLEMILYTNVKIKKIGIAIPSDIESRVESMITVLDNLIEEDGSIPLIGDNDNGRFLPFQSIDVDDVRYLITLSGELYSNKIYCNYSSQFVPELFFIAEKFETTKNHIQKNKERIIFYKDAGFCILNSENTHITIHNNPMSRFTYNEDNLVYSSHSHLDMLSFTLSYGKFRLIVDPGSYCYTSNPAERIKFRSTCMHNTICVGEMDQQEQYYNKLFSLKQNSFPVFTKVDKSGYFVGKYEYRKNRIVEYSHERKLSILDKSIYLIDTIENFTNKSISFNLHLGEDAIPSIENDCVKIKQKEHKWELLFDSDFPISIEIKNDLISPSYGVLKDSYKIVCRINSQEIKQNLSTCIKILNEND